MDFNELNKFRKEYQGKPIQHEGITSPFVLFEKWFEEAVQARCTEPNAMILSTCDGSQPSSRVVLLKQFDEKGFYFFTNYLSRKGQEISKNPRVSLLFYWAKLFRQVRIEGLAEKSSSQISDEYFNSRPLESRIHAIISPQSRVIISRESLLKQAQSLKESPDEIKRPPYWGGYIVLPTYFEFFQGMENRLHDRVVFILQNNKWIKKQLAP